jgi:hypothetical protein
MSTKKKYTRPDHKKSNENFTLDQLENRKTIIGIDNGTGGALYAMSLYSGMTLDFSKMPTWISREEKRNEKRVDVVELKRWLLRTDLSAKIIVCIEAPPDHMQQALSLKSTAMAFGSITSTLDLLGIPWIKVAPKVWQKEMLGEFKAGESKTRALEVFTELTGISESAAKKEKINHDIIDAYHIANYARLKIKHTLEELT